MQGGSKTCDWLPIGLRGPTHTPSGCPIQLGALCVAVGVVAGGAIGVAIEGTR